MSATAGYKSIALTPDASLNLRDRAGHDSPPNDGADASDRLDAPGRYLNLTGTRGSYVGDSGIQINLFTGVNQARGPVVAGNVPQAAPAFQVREDLMAQLRSAGPGISVVCTLTGMRGVGKTQLAAVYARECAAGGWRLVAWVNAEDPAELLADLAVVADRLGMTRADRSLEDVALEVCNRLEADGERCLIVFDNVTDLAKLRPYLPGLGASQAIVTTNDASLGSSHTPLAVDVFSEEESLTFLAQRTRMNDFDGAHRLANELGHLPLALAQAAAVMTSQHLNYQTYLDRLSTYPAQRYLPPARSDPYPRGTSETILLSLNALADFPHADLCRGIVDTLSLLSPSGVSREILYLGKSAGIWAADSAAVDEALGRLAEVSLLVFSENASAVSAHRLVMRVAREHRVYDGTLPALGMQACNLLSAAALSFGEAWQRRAEARDLVQQVHVLNEHLIPWVSTNGDSLTEALLSRRIWALQHLYDLGDSALQMIKIGEPLTADCTRLLGSDHPDTLMSRNYLALAYRAAGRPNEAMPLLEQNLADRIRVLGEDHRDTLRSLSNLAMAYRAARRVDEALPLLEKALVDRVRVLGDDDPDTLKARNNLAIAYRSAGRTNEAILLYERTLADRIRILGDDHPETLRSRRSLALALMDAGLIEEAISLFEQALAGRERVLGSEHPDTVLLRKELLRAREEAIPRESNAPD